MDKIYIVMNYVEHDLKSLMETMKQPFLPGNKNCRVAVHYCGKLNSITFFKNSNAVATHQLCDIMLFLR